MDQNLAADQKMETGSAPTTEEKAEVGSVVSRNVLGAHEDDSGREMDRTDPEEARAVLERVVPDEAARRACLALLADAIKTAHDTAPASWSVTLFRDGVRLNVGAVETTVVGRKRRGTIYLLVDGRTLEPGAQEPTGDEEMEWNEEQMYASFPGARGIFIRLEAAERVLPAWRKAHLELVRGAAQARPVVWFRRSHSPAVPEFLGLTLGRDLPLGPEVQEDERPAGEIGYWKIAPGEGAWQWEECRREGFIAMGWEELGNCRGLSKEEYLKRRAETIEAGHDFSRGDMQPWIFANQIKPGDRIVVNRGRDEVLGIGTVTGPYEFVPGVRHGHHLPVRWDITEPFAVTRRPWIKTIARLDQSSFEQILAEREANGNAGEASAFTPRAFELLDGLRRDPTKAYVTGHKDELKSLVEEPFKNLFRRTAKMLPPGILSRMEWEQKCFGRFLKNDYGQGGANPYFWGALYPRGGKRTEDAQLFLWIRADYFGYGFSIGQHGSETSRRFRANLEKHRAELAQLIDPSLTELGVVYGGPAELRTDSRQGA